METKYELFKVYKRGFRQRNSSQGNSESTKHVKYNLKKKTFICGFKDRSFDIYKKISAQFPSTSFQIVTKGSPCNYMYTV